MASEAENIMKEAFLAEDIIDEIREFGIFPDQEIKFIKNLGGGISHNFLIEVGDKQYVIKTPNYELTNTSIASLQKEALLAILLNQSEIQESEVISPGLVSFVTKSRHWPVGLREKYPPLPGSSNSKHMDISNSDSPLWISKDYDYLVLEYIEGEPLPDVRELFNQYKEEELKEKLQVVWSTLKMIAENADENFRKHRIVNFDIKPDSILLTKDGKIGVIDHGDSKIVPPSDINRLTFAFLTHGGATGSLLEAVPYLEEVLSKVGIKDLTRRYPLIFHEVFTLLIIRMLIPYLEGSCMSEGNGPLLVSIADWLRGDDPLEQQDDKVKNDIEKYKFQIGKIIHKGFGLDEFTPPKAEIDSAEILSNPCTSAVTVLTPLMQYLGIDQKS